MAGSATRIDYAPMNNAGCEANHNGKWAEPDKRKRS
jgi:hypothetical protein